jgi:hypothetical protein
MGTSSPDEFNIRAETSPATVGSVRFGFNGDANFATEGTAPYALFGDASGDYNAWTPGLGSQTVTATAYDATGNPGGSLSLSFQVVDNSPPPPGCGDSGTNLATLSGELLTWHKLTLDVNGPGSSEDCVPNPFLDYRMTVTFSHPGSGKSYVVPGFFAADGNAAESSATAGNIWRCHFAADEVGSWNWEASFRTGTEVAISLDPLAGTATAFDGLQGSFSIGSTNKTGRDHRGKGRLQYVGKRYLQFAGTGEYFLKGGADAPENLLAYADFDISSYPNNGLVKTWTAHLGDWQAGDPEWQSGKGHGLIGALNYLAGKGMNVVSFLTMNIGGDDRNVFPYPTYNNQSSPQDDRRRIDVSKLAQWEIVFAHADQQGLYLHFKTQETENDQLLDQGQLGTERKLYYRELVARFGHHLALNWNLGEENDIWSELNDPQQSLIKSYAQYLRAIDPYDHHIVLHTYPGQQNQGYNPLLGDANALTGLSIQTGYNNVHQDTRRWVSDSEASGFPWVVANDEQGSANCGVPPDPDWPGYTHPGSCPVQEEIVEKVLWGNLLAGGAGVEYYFGYSLPHSDLSCQDFRSRDQMWDYTRYALEFFQSLPFAEMESRDDLVSSGYCLAKEGESYVVYRPGGSSPTLDLPTNSQFEVLWLNPRDGSSSSAPDLSGGNNQALGSPPSDPGADWVVKLSLTGASLPVELLGFTAEPLERKVQLAWTTSHEENSAFFQVERSLDGQAFFPLDQLNAAGQSDSVLHYQWLDESLPALQLWYRLKMVDLNGTFSYSEVRRVELATSSLVVYPNPLREFLYLSIPPEIAAAHSELDIRFYGLSGQEVWRQNRSLAASSGSLPLNLKDLLPGIYFLQIQAGAEVLYQGRVWKMLEE